MVYFIFLIFTPHVKLIYLPRGIIILIFRYGPEKNFYIQNNFKKLKILTNKYSFLLSNHRNRWMSLKYCSIKILNRGRNYDFMVTVNVKNKCFKFKNLVYYLEVSLRSIVEVSALDQVRWLKFSRCVYLLS